MWRRGRAPKPEGLLLPSASAPFKPLEQAVQSVAGWDLAGPPVRFGSHSHPSAGEDLAFPCAAIRPSALRRSTTSPDPGAEGPAAARTVEQAGHGPSLSAALTGRPLASAAAATPAPLPLLPATHTTPALGNPEARHSRRLHPLRSRTVFSAPQARRTAGTSYLRPTQPPSWPLVWRLAHCKTASVGAGAWRAPRTARAPLHPGCVFTDARRGRPTTGYTEPGLLRKQTGVRGDSRGGPGRERAGNLSWAGPSADGRVRGRRPPWRRLGWVSLAVWGSPTHNLAPQQRLTLVARPRKSRRGIWCNAFLTHRIAPAFWESEFQSVLLLERNEDWDGGAQMPADWRRCRANEKQFPPSRRASFIGSTNIFWAHRLPFLVGPQRCYVNYLYLALLELVF